MNLLIEIKSADGEPLGVIAAAPKDFKTGSRGFYGQAKIEIDGKLHQAQIQLVEIGSKKQPRAETAAEPDSES
jgi:hypothetical protein